MKYLALALVALVCLTGAASSFVLAKYFQPLVHQVKK